LIDKPSAPGVASKEKSRGDSTMEKEQDKAANQQSQEWNQEERRKE
jgi:hypothetical protein